MYKSKNQKYLTYTVFSVYMLLLTWLVIFKLGIDISALAHIRTVNFIPFYYDGSVSSVVHIKEVLYNVLVFIPLGVYVGIFRPEWKLYLKILPGFCVSLIFEVIQYAFAIGIADITDLISNTLGSMAGVGIFYIIRKISENKCLTVINIIGGAVECVAVMLFGVLLISNL